MLDAALQYKKAIVTMTGDLDKGFREFELTKEEWEIAKHLRDVLKVRVIVFGAVARARASWPVLGDAGCVPPGAPPVSLSLVSRLSSSLLTWPPALR